LQNAKFSIHLILKSRIH